MPTPDCPPPVDLTQGPPEDAAAWPDLPPAFAADVLWECIDVYYDWPTGPMLKDAEVVADPDAWRTRAAPLGDYEYPAAVWTQRAFEVDTATTDVRRNPWTLTAQVYFMDDDATGGTHSEDLHWTGTTDLAGFATDEFSFGILTLLPRAGTSPVQYAGAGSFPSGPGRYPDPTTGKHEAVPAGSAGSTRTWLRRYGDEHPFQRGLWTGAFSYNLPPFDPPPVLPPCPDGTPPVAQLGWTRTPDQQKTWQWRGGAALDVVVPFTDQVAPAGGPWEARILAHHDPMTSLWGRRAGGAWRRATLSPLPGGWSPAAGKAVASWPGWVFGAPDAIEVGVSNAASGDWSAADYTDARMGRVSITPSWAMCGQPASKFHLG